MKYLIISILSISLLSSCSQSLDLNLPMYEPKLTVEFYLENGKPLRCLLQESLNYTDQRLVNWIDDAIVLLKYGDQVDTLQNNLYLDTLFDKAYNYYNPKIFEAKTNVTYTLYIKDKQGRELSSTTKYTEPIKIDSTLYDFNSEDEARVGLVFSDPAQSINFYQIVALPADTVVTEEDTWDFSLEDNSFNGLRFSFFTGYSFERNRTVVARLYNLDSEYHAYLQSVSIARESNFNPFGQPAPIRSNIIGGLGIFTVLSYDEVRVMVK